MPRLSERLLIPVAIVVIAWGGAHLLASRDSVAVQPSSWPTVSPAPAPSGSGLLAPAASVAASPSPAPTGGDIPFLPDMFAQLNGDTRDTALGLDALITQLEGAVGAHIRQLVQQLEPGG
jgi:hypothetical protein